jgi:glycosyltransferase involved in cell wall biosynthesis
MNISVVVPTYKRLNDLRRCLTALDNQTSLPHEVIVVVKSFDFETVSYILDWTAEKTLYSRKFCTVAIPGVVQAMIQGVEVASGEVVAFTDDDSAPDSTWLLNMERHYQNPKVGGVGGRDILCNHPVVPLKTKVGKLTWYGKLIGNHHLGDGPPREVDVLKGVNMSFRKQLVEFSPFLRGNGGPENHNEVGLCLRVKHIGYSLVYDPTIIVNHYAAPRIDSEQRTQFNAESVQNSAFNIQMSLLAWLPWHQKLFRLVYSTLIGDKAYPGLMRFLTAVVRREVRVVKSYIPAQVGFLIAMMHYCGWIFRIGSNISRDSSEPRTQYQKTVEDA